MERAAKALPLISERRVVLRNLEGMGEVVALPDSFSKERSLEQQKLQQARVDERDALAELDVLTHRLDKLVVPEGVLEQHKIITEQQKQLGSQEKAERDLPSLEGKLKLAESDILGILKELGRAPSLAEVGSVRLPAAFSVRIQTLSSSHQALQERLAKAQEAVADLSSEIGRLQSEMDSIGVLRDATKLREVIDCANADGDPDKEKAKLSRLLQEQESQASIDLKGLGLWHGPLDQVGTIPVPVDETMERFVLMFAELQTEERSVAEKLRNLEDEGSAIEAEIRALRLAGDVPTEKDLASSRACRDGAWRSLRSAWRGGGAQVPGSSGSTASTRSRFVTSDQTSAAIESGEMIGKWSGWPLAVIARWPAERSMRAPMVTAPANAPLSFSSAWSVKTKLRAPAIAGPTPLMPGIVTIAVSPPPRTNAPPRAIRLGTRACASSIGANRNSLAMASSFAASSCTAGTKLTSGATGA